MSGRVSVSQPTSSVWSNVAKGTSAGRWTVGCLSKPSVGGRESIHCEPLPIGLLSRAAVRRRSVQMRRQVAREGLSLEGCDGGVKMTPAHRRQRASAEQQQRALMIGPWSAPQSDEDVQRAFRCRQLRAAAGLCAPEFGRLARRVAVRRASAKTARSPHHPHAGSRRAAQPGSLTQMLGPQAGAPLQRWGREAKKQHKRSTVQWWCPAIWRHAATTTPHPSSAASLSAANGEWSAGAGGLAMGIRRIQGTRNAGTWNSGIELSTIPSSLWPLPPSCRDCRKSCAHSTGPRDPSKAAAASPP